MDSDIEIRQLQLRRNHVRRDESGNRRRAIYEWGDPLAVEIRDALFDEFEDLSESFRQAGWEADYLQLGRGQFRGRLLCTASGSTQIYRGRWTRGIRHIGLQPSGTVALAVSLCQEDGAGRFLGAPIGPDDVIVQSGRTEFELFGAPTWEAAVFLMPEAEISEQVAALTQRDPQSILKHHGFATLRSPQSAALRHACGRYFDAVDAVRRRPDLGPALEPMADALVSMAIRDVLEARLEPLPPPRLHRRREIVRRTADYASSCESGKLRISDLCRNVGVGERSLRYAFADLAGISPAAYLRRERLNRVHQTLLKADPGETLIKTVAYEHGFWHLGQFSRDYLQHFGQRPSETLAG